MPQKLRLVRLANVKADPVASEVGVYELEMPDDCMLQPGGTLIGLSWRESGSIQMCVYRLEEDEESPDDQSGRQRTG